MPKHLLINAILIEQGVVQEERIVLLNKTACKQLATLINARIEHNKLLALPKNANKKKKEK